MKKVILAGALGIVALAGTNLSGLEATTASAAIQEFNTTVEGKVGEVNTAYFVVESKQLKENVTVYTDFQSNVKVGEYVIINSKGPLFQNAFTTSVTADSVEHLELAPGNYKDFVVGHVSKLYPADADFDDPAVKVDYPTVDGNVNSVIVTLSEGQSFKINDLVKVERGFWTKSIPAQATDGIEKVKSHIDSAKNSDNNDQWIWS
ncbi:hypothetical protein ACQKMD_12745 [Viridibacillus sp. NPDC096237]|uniref:hypothetical protein n=1 Tax=Viridibacillus sp. NPDC096237 TaxID=3390721 RepID=UPI003D01924A